MSKYFLTEMHQTNTSKNSTKCTTANYYFQAYYTTVSSTLITALAGDQGGNDSFNALSSTLQVLELLPGADGVEFTLEELERKGQEVSMKL